MTMTVSSQDAARDSRPPTRTISSRRSPSLVARKRSVDRTSSSEAREYPEARDGLSATLGHREEVRSQIRGGVARSFWLGLEVEVHLQRMSAGDAV